MSDFVHDCVEQIQFVREHLLETSAVPLVLVII